MALAVAPLTPTLDVAAEAAKACADLDPRIVEVLVFGSIARGDAAPGSDIDLLVIVDDASAQTSPARSSGELAAAARAAAGISCDVTVRDFAAWQHMVHNVSASFESTASRDAQPVYRRTSTPPAPEACILGGIARDNMDVAANYARGAARQLDIVAALVTALHNTELAESTGPSELVQETRLGRTQSLLSESRLAIELAIRSIAASAQGVGYGKQHKLEDMVPHLDPGLRRLADNALRPLQLADGTYRNWRSGPYSLNEPDWIHETTAQNAHAHITAALALARVAARQLTGPPSTTDRPAQAAALLQHRIAALEAQPHSPADLS